MADRLWGQVDAKLYDEDWSDCATVIAACLLARCPTEHGVFDLPLGYLKRRFVQTFSGEQIESAISELEAAGLLKLYRERRVVWLIGRWKRSRWHMMSNNFKGALADLQKSYPEVAEAFADRYSALVTTQSAPSPYDVSTKSARRKHIVLTTESDSDSEEEERESSLRSDSLPGTVAPGPRRSPHKKRDLEAIEKAQYPLVERLGQIIALARFEAGLAAVDQDPAAAARIIRQLVELDGVLLKEIEPTCRWMFTAERKFYCENLSLIHNWRKRWDNGVAFCTARDKWKLSQTSAPQAGTQQYASQRSGNGRVMPSGNYVSDPIPGDEPEVQV